MDEQRALATRRTALNTPAGLGSNAVQDISGALNLALADMFSLFLKTKNFHWHMSGDHFYGHHLMLDKQSDQLIAATDVLAERVRKVGGRTIRSIGEIGRLQRILDNDAEFVSPGDMIAELHDDNLQLSQALRETHRLCDDHGDVASAGLLENWIDEAEQRTWFLFEASRR